MEKETWVLHIEGSGLVRPSLGGDKKAWKDRVVEHLESLCKDCLERRKTRAKNVYARARHEALTSVGLQRVRGSLGGVYYE